MRVQILKVTPEMAKKWLLKNKSNRKLDEKIVAKYAYEMEIGKWKLTGDAAIVFDKGGWLKNGQHRLHAIIKSGVTIETVVSFDVDDDAMPYFDIGKNRTLGDVFQIKDISNSNNMSSIVKTYYYFYLEITISGSDRSRELKISREDYLEKYYEFPEFWEEILKLARKCYNVSHLYTISIIGGFAAYLILDKKKKEEQVYAFFYQLFGIENDLYSCTKALRNLITKDLCSRKKLRPSDKNKLLIKTWNYFQDKRDIKVLTIQDKEEIKVK